MSANASSVSAWLPGHDARWVIATVLTVAGLLWMKSDGLESRLDDMNRRIDDLRADVTRRIAELRTDLRRIDDRLRAVEIAVRPAVPAPRQQSPSP